jgi:hypothetical protein
MDILAENRVGEFLGARMDILAENRVGEFLGARMDILAENRVGAFLPLKPQTDTQTHRHTDRHALLYID